VFAIQAHLDYTGWASLRLLEAAAKLTREELTRDFGTADRSVLGTLVHVFASDRVWLGRIEGNLPARFLDPEKDLHMEVLQRDWPPLWDRWKSLGARSEEAMSKRIAYHDLKGNPHQTPLWQILLHVVNHATHHRGQVSGFMRAMGKAPPPLDLIYYYRELGS
jgi:uncharacterized damage-inducible protein DinB